MADDGATVEIDSVTGSLIHYRAPFEILSENTCKNITSEEARQIAEEFISRHGSLQKLDFDGVKYNESLDGYYVSYVRYVAGYKSAEYARVTIGANGKVLSYLSNPHAFDGIDADKLTIDNEKLMRKINAAVEEQFSGDNYSIDNLRLIVVDGQLKMEYSVFVTDEVGAIGGYSFEISLD